LTGLLTIAEVAIIATHAIGQCRNITSCHRVACVLGTGVLVIAIYKLGHTIAAYTGTILCTSRSVVARPIEEEVLTNPGSTIAAVFGALVTIFTIRRALTTHASGDNHGATGSRRGVTTIGCTRITVVAIHGVSHTPIELPVSVFTIAKIYGARVTVITISGLTAAYTKAANVTFRTWVAVIATTRVMTRHTFPCGRVTAVVSTFVTVVATQRNTFASASLHNTLIVM